MKYEVRVQNRHAPDVVITDVEESDVGNVVTTWCSARSVCIVTPKESGVSKSTHASLCNCVDVDDVIETQNAKRRIISAKGGAE